MAGKSGASNQAISLPQGGGALQGIGEKFSPDLHTGTGNFTVPIALPRGRNGFQPQLSLGYSTGSGNGPFGLGWSTSVPGVSRKTSQGIPLYDDLQDTFILSGAEDLVLVKDDPVKPRTAWIWGYALAAASGSNPAQVSNPTTISAIAAGGNHSLALTSDSLVWAWGINSSGELGDGTTTNRPTPIQVSSLGTVAAIAAGNTHSLALKPDGAVWSWGLNTYGQLGDGTTTNRLTPVQVQGLSGIVAIAAGKAQNMALKSDGTVWAWGYNAYGNLGDGTQTNRSTPVRVQGLSNVVAIAYGSSGGHGLALKSDGSVWAWGPNSWGQLGDGTTTLRLTPVQVSGLANVMAIAAGDAHSLALKSDGTVWAWGSNTASPSGASGGGQLGDGTLTNRSAPVQVNITGVVAIAGGGAHSLALKADGTVWGWGANGAGQLGDGTQTSRTKPVQVLGLTHIASIAAGTWHGLALQAEPASRQYRPRTEGLFAKITHYHDAKNDYWQVRSRDGMVSLYGTPGVAGRDPAVIADPNNRAKIFTWKLTRTTDPFGNFIEYVYQRDAVQIEDAHRWDQNYLSEIHYADYGDSANPQFLVKVKFTYTDRPDHFSNYRAGFEIRTVQRCAQIDISTNAGAEIVTRTFHLDYFDQSSPASAALPLNRISLLAQVRVEGRDGSISQWLPPLRLAYGQFQPEGRRFLPITGPDLPPASLADPDYELADLFGRGLPDILEMNGTVRYWRNLGGGQYDLSQEMRYAPAGVGLANPGVQLVDANGDGRLDLMVTSDVLSGYYPLRFGGLWDSRSFQRYQAAPSFNLKDPEVHLVDLDGDGVTDAIRSGTRLECFFNDPHAGWIETRVVERQSLDVFPNVSFSDPRVKWADMTGDGLQDVVMIYDGCVEYWPSLGRGNWARRVTMQNSPHFPYGYDPKRILLGDVDGDGAADLVYVDDMKITLWINRSGNGWSDPITIKGTPPVSDVDAVRLVDMFGNGISGVLWSADAGLASRANMYFLDLTGGVKPYLLTEIDNQTGAITRIAYRSSTQFYLKDQKQPATRWQTPLPFPVQVVAQVEAIDAISGGKLTTEYNYHHGYWDGAEREFRGFGRVDQRDTETIGDYNAAGLHPGQPFQQVEPTYFSPPTETRTWFHQGPVGDEFGDWTEADFSAEFWPGDPQALSRPQSVTDFLDSLPRRVKRDALRVLRGHILRTELYALDGAQLQNRPYTVTEQVYGVREELPSGLAVTGQDSVHIFFPYVIAQRTTQWERGTEPMSSFSFTGDYDAYGQARSQISIAAPRGRDFRVAVQQSEPYLATQAVTDYAQRDDPQVYTVDRVARTTNYEILNNGCSTLLDLKAAIETGSVTRNLIGQTINFYDGDAFKGLPFGQLGNYGALVRTENLVLTEDILNVAYKSGGAVLTPPEAPPYLKPAGPPNWNVALVANGATASASSTYDGDYPPSTVINGDRKGGVWPPYWADNTYNAYPDWIQVDFKGPKTINEIDVFTTQDAPLTGTGPAVDPTPDLTFKVFGITAFDVQYWDGSNWVTVPNGSVTNNNNVWRQFKFADITTPKIRVVVNNAIGGYSRIVEVEAYESGTGVNVALAQNGGATTASSVIQPWPPREAIDGDRIVYHWVGQVPFQFPGWLQVNFKGPQTINEVDVFFHQDVSKPMVTPTEDLTTPYAVTDFEIQYWDGANWMTAPGGSVTGNNKVWRKFRFSYVTTDRIRLFMYKSSDGNVRVQEFEAYAVDPGWLSGDYPPEFQTLLPMIQAVDSTRPGLNITAAGYGFAEGDATFVRGYFVATARQHYDFHDDPLGKGYGLAKAARDPLGRDTTVAYDNYNLLPVQVANPAGLTTTAAYDYRVLQPNLVTDANGNRTAYAFSPLGLLASTAVMGKVTETVGDTLAVPGLQLSYDLTAFAERGRPISVHTIRRVYHVNEADAPQSDFDATTETVEYSDGLGRLLQARTLAENILFGDVVLPSDQTDQKGTLADLIGRQRASSDPPNIVVSGWQVYDNKGRVVEKYEPFFSIGWDYAAPTDAQRGQKVKMYYDPRGQVICTVNPDGSEQRVVHGVPSDLANPDQFTPTPWETYTYDANDNAGRTAPTASDCQDHWNTPASTVIDALGRTVRIVARNGSNAATDWYTTRSTYDIRGNLLTITDALGRIAFQHVYDLANRPLRVENIDAGIRRTILDAAGNTLELRDSKGALILHAYDVLSRPTRLWARDGANQPLTLREYLCYGDGADSGLTVAQATASNLLGKLYKHYDEAGLTTVMLCDFKGNVLEKTRQVIGDAAILSAFNPPPSSWQVQAYRVNWQPPGGTTLTDYANTLLDATIYQTSITYDALNRIKTMLYPQGVDSARQQLLPRYNRAGTLESVGLGSANYVQHIAYNARGQRTLIAYGNGVMTRYAYDPQTFRLMRLRTEQYTMPTTLTYHPTGTVLQDLAYEYDLVGNITKLHDRTPGSGIPNTLLGQAALDRVFVYDPIYRLLSATGRECDAPPPPPPWNDQPRCTDLTRVRGYTEQYQYDPIGNLLQLRHGSNGDSFTRQYVLVPNANRLAALTIGSATYQYAYDSNGNLVQENASRHFEWDHSDRMRVYRTQTDGAEPSVHAHYLYGADGGRVKKLVRKQGGRYEVTIYIDGFFEHHRLVQGSTIQENNTLHVMDNQKRIALVRVGNPFPGDTSPAIQYLLSDHLGSSNVVVDDAGSWTNREEYTPYGETSFGSFAKKRYRFTGKERDEESGLYYHGARYYAPWLARWQSPDPAGHVDGTNLYCFVRNRPIVLTDTTGLIGEGPTLSDAHLKPAKGQFGHVAPMNKQGKAIRNAAGARLSESEHVVPRGNLEAVTTDPRTGRIDYTEQRYRSDATVRVERSMALDKTNPNRGGMMADNARTADLKARASSGQPINYREDVFMASIDNAKRAAQKTGSVVADEAIHRAALEQDANLFASMRPDEVAAHLAAYESKQASLGTKVLQVGGKLARGVGAALEVGGGILGSATGGWQVGSGIDAISQGHIAEGAVDVAEGAANLGLTIGVPVATKAGLIAAEAGAAAGAVGLAAGVAAGASVGLAAETARAAINGEQTPLDVADKFYGTHFGDLYGWVTGAYSKK